MKKFSALGAGIALLLAAGASAQSSGSDRRQRALLGPMADHLMFRVGTWDVRADLRLQPNARPVTIVGKAENKLVGGRWLVTEVRGGDERGGMVPFHGLGVNGYDPDRKKYVGYWIDGTRGITIPVEGEFDARSRVFRTTSVETDSKGKRVIVHSETRQAGPDTEVTTFTAPDARGRPFTRMVLTYTRAGTGRQN